MPEKQPFPPHGFTVGRDQPLIGILVREDGQEAVRYFTDEQQADAARGQRSIQRALSLAGAWSDMDWVETEEELDRIRHESQPTPPIDLSDLVS